MSYDANQNILNVLLLPKHARDPRKLPDIPPNTVRRNIEYLMKEWGLKQSDLAKALDVHPSQISRWLQQDDEDFAYRTLQRIGDVIGAPGPLLGIPFLDETWLNFPIISAIRHQIEAALDEYSR